MFETNLFLMNICGLILDFSYDVRSIWYSKKLRHIYIYGRFMQQNVIPVYTEYYVLSHSPDSHRNMDKS